MAKVLYLSYRRFAFAAAIGLAVAAVVSVCVAKDALQSLVLSGPHASIPPYAPMIPLHPMLPRFALPEDLRGAPEWHSYLREIYGPTVDDPKHYPIDVSTFALLYGRQKDLKGLLAEEATCLDRRGRERRQGGWCTFHDTNNECPKRPGDMYGCATCGEKGCLWDLHDWMWIFQGTAQQAYPEGLQAGTWVEVTHCNSPRESNGRGTWMYHAKGSGVFINTGSTAVFRKHKDAESNITGRPNRNCHQCDDQYASLMRSAQERGLTTIQFTSHSDMRCGNTHLELVHVVFSNGNNSKVPIRCGLNASCECNCTYEINDAGHSCPICRPVCPSSPDLRPWETSGIQRDGRAAPRGQASATAASQWQRVCSLERARYLAAQEKAIPAVNPSHSGVGWDNALARLRSLLNSRSTVCLGNQSCTVQDLGSSRLRVCTMGSRQSRFCEVRPRGWSANPSFVIRKMCRAGEEGHCFDFDMASVREKYRKLRARVGMQRLPTCAVVGSGHSLRCGVPAGASIDDHSGVFRTNNYPSSTNIMHTERLGLRTTHAYNNCDRARGAACLRNIRQLQSNFSGGHSGGFITDVAIAICDRVDVYGFGMFSYGVDGDVLYQHWDDHDFAPSCSKDFDCFHETATASCGSNRAEFGFYERNGHKLCNRDVVCGQGDERGLPRSEAQLDFFFQSELRLHVLDAFGIINWVWYNAKR